MCNLSTACDLAENGIALSVRGVHQSFGNKHVLNNVNLDVKAGQIVAIVGPSGCGKSTLLRSILGTHPPTKGEIIAEGGKVDGPSRKVGIVYQDYALYPFLTAEKNVAFGPKMDQTNIFWRAFFYHKWLKLQKTHLEDARKWLAKVRLLDAKDNYPSELSGGMKQRVAVAQALAMRPSILLMDEPFGALDEATRESLQLMLLEFYQENMRVKKAGGVPPYTILIVTHELNEALYVSDRVIGLTQYHPDGKNGATVVYDFPAPVFHPGDPKDTEKFAKQKEEIRNIVFSPDNVNNAKTLIRLWGESDEFLPGLSTDRI